MKNDDDSYLSSIITPNFDLLAVYTYVGKDGVQLIVLLDHQTDIWQNNERSIFDRIVNNTSCHQNLSHEGFAP